MMNFGYSKSAVLLMLPLFILIFGCDTEAGKAENAEMASLISDNAALVSATASDEHAIKPPCGGNNADGGSEGHETIIYSPSFSIPWGNGHGHVGWYPPSPESRARGPMSLAADPDGSFWILDQLNLRAVKVDNNGNHLKSIAIPLGAADIVKGSDGILYVFSLVNRRISAFHNGMQVEEIRSPLAMPHISRFEVDDDGNIRLINHTQHTFNLGGPGSRIEWPDILNTRVAGVEGISGGPAMSAVLYRGRAALSIQQDNPREFDYIFLKDTENAVSVVLLDTEPDGSAVVILERFDDDEVKRTIRRVDSSGELLHEAVLPAASMIYPYREFAVRPMGPVHQIAGYAEGLTVYTYDMGRGR